MMLPFFSANYADALVANGFDGDDDGRRRQAASVQWRRIRTMNGYYLVPDMPAETSAEGEVNPSSVGGSTTDSVRTETPSRTDRVRWDDRGDVPARHGISDGTLLDAGLSTRLTHPTTNLISHVRFNKKSARTSDGSITTNTFSSSSFFERSKRKPLRTMTVKPHTWISLWFLLTAPVIFWDAGYCFMRPRSMKGGDLHWIWSPYALYQEVDYVYGIKALEENNGFTAAQSLLNIIETFMNLAYLYLAHVQKSPAAIVVGFAAVVMTLSKTILYWAQEYFCGFCAIGHNSAKDLLVLWIIPNGLWIVVPALIVHRFGKDLIGQLYTADRAAKKAALEKKR